MELPAIPDFPTKMAAPDILLPPEVIWNLSRLSRYLMTSWRSTEQDDGATLSITFDKSQPTKIRSSGNRNRLPLKPLVPDLPVLSRRPMEDISSDLLDAEGGVSRHSITSPIRVITKRDESIASRVDPRVMGRQRNQSVSSNLIPVPMVKELRISKPSTTSLFKENPQCALPVLKSETGVPLPSAKAPTDNQLPVIKTEPMDINVETPSLLTNTTESQLPVIKTEPVSPKSVSSIRTDAQQSVPIVKREPTESKQPVVIPGENRSGSELEVKTGAGVKVNEPDNTRDSRSTTENTKRETTTKPSLTEVQKEKAVPEPDSTKAKVQPKRSRSTSKMDDSETAQRVRRQIDSLLKSCRSQSERTPFQQQDNTGPNPTTSQPASITRTISTPPLDSYSSDSEGESATLVTDSVRKKTTSRKTPKRESIGLKTTVFFKESRKRKVYRKSSQPGKRRAVRIEPSTSSTPMVKPCISGFSESLHSEFPIGGYTTGQRYTEDKENFRVNDHEFDESAGVWKERKPVPETVAEYMEKIRNRICQKNIGHANQFNVVYTVADRKDSFYISSYSRRERNTIMHEDITLPWLQKNSWKMPVFTIQQAGLRILYKKLAGQNPTGLVSNTMKDLVAHLL